MFFTSLYLFSSLSGLTLILSTTCGFRKNVNQFLSPPLEALDLMFIYIYNTLPYLTPEVLNTFFHALIYLLSYIVNINLKFYYEKLVQLLFSSSAISLMRTFAASAASRFGRKAGVSGFNFVLLSFPKSQLSSFKSVFPRSKSYSSHNAVFTGHQFSTIPNFQ